MNLTGSEQDTPTIAHLAALDCLDAAADNVESQVFLTSSAAVYAQLATADAIDRLTAALELMQFLTLEVKKCLTSVGYKIQPVKR